jgi:RNA polymerase sigma-70 factor, ECF subfamily
VSGERPPMAREQLPPGWREEIAECFKAMALMVYGVLLRFAQGDQELAAALVQETFRRATRKWHMLRALTDEQRRAWLIRVAVACAIDAFRRADTERRKRPQIQARYQPRATDVHEDAMTAIAVEHFIKVLNKMPPQRARVAFLYWGCEWTNGEIARALGITPGRVSQQVAAAKARLRSELAPYVPFEPDEPEGGTSS